MVLTVSSALSPVIGLLVTVVLWIISARLDASVETSGPHGFAVRIRRFRLKRRQRPSHPAPTFVTIAKRPLDLERDKANRKCDLGEARNGFFLSARLDGANQLEPHREIRFLAHAIFMAEALRK
jgi:hypothetical protein